MLGKKVYNSTETFEVLKPFIPFPVVISHINSTETFEVLKQQWYFYNCSSTSKIQPKHLKY